MQDSLAFVQGFFIGQISICALLFCFIKFFIFGEVSGSNSARPGAGGYGRYPYSTARRATHSRSYSGRQPPVAPRTNPLRPTSSQALSTPSILSKTFYNVNSHPPESLDWFNVLIAQTITQLRTDAQADPAAVAGSLTAVLNGDRRPDWLGEIKVTEISLGEEFPIFGNCRVIPLEDDDIGLEGIHPFANPSGYGFGRGAGGSASNRPRSASGIPAGVSGEPRLQARMDVDLSDSVTLGIETKLVLNFPKPYTAVIPVALSVSVVRFSGTLSISFIPSPSTAKATSAANSLGVESPFDDEYDESDDQRGQSSTSPPTTLTFSFAPDYRLELSTHSLLGSRSRLQDVPKIAQLVDSRLHAWFDERCVAPRFQQVDLPSFWPRKRRTRGGDSESAAGDSVQQRDRPVSSSGGNPERNSGAWTRTPTMPPVREVDDTEFDVPGLAGSPAFDASGNDVMYNDSMNIRKRRGEQRDTRLDGSRQVSGLTVDNDKFRIPGSMPA